MSYIIFLTICAIWGSSFILMDRAVTVFPPEVVAFWRVAAGAAVVAAFASVQRKSLAVPKRDWAQLFLVGGFAYAWSYVLQAVLISRGFGHGLMGMMVVFVPLATIVASVPLLGVRPTARQLIGVIGGLACFILISMDTHQRGISTGMLGLAITVPISYAVANTYVKRRLHETPLLPLTFWTLSAGGFVLFLIGLRHGLRAFFVGVAGIDSSAWGVAAASVLVLGVLSTGVAMLLFNHLLIRHGPLFAGMVTYIVPLGAVLMGGADNEVITPYQVAALSGALITVGLVQYRAANVPASKVQIQTVGQLENE